MNRLKPNHPSTFPPSSHTGSVNTSAGPPSLTQFLAFFTGSGKRFDTSYL
jgi:hypothetical protein